MANIIYPLPFATSGQVQIQGAFDLVKRFDSREGVVELVSSKRHPKKLRIVKSVKHTDPRRAPAEARALAQRTLPNGAHHPNIIKMFSAELNPRSGTGLMIFEYCTGGDLYQQVSKRHATPLFALHIFISVAEALAFIHNGMVYKDGGSYQKVVHGEPLVHSDNKDDNVFLRFPGSTGGGLPDVVLADFGLGNLESQTKPGWGCIPFMSPECRFRTVTRLSHKTDIYSFGVMIENILNHEGKGFWPIYTDPKNLVIDYSYKGLGFTDVLRRCLAVRASDRGDFSSFHGSGMLQSLLKFREKRSTKLRNGETIKKNYWVAKV